MPVAILPVMTRHLFRHLRHCRALFALALCAWLALASVVWAQPAGCCAAMAASMDMSHAPASHDHGADHAVSMLPDGCCAHATVTVPPSAWGHVMHVEIASQGWLARREAAPQPVYDPPLRPPVA